MTLNYNLPRGRRSGRPPCQIKNWIPRIVLAQAVALALLAVSGFASGGFLRLPGLPSKGATAGSPNVVESRGLAFAWATLGSFHISRAPGGAHVAGETGNRYHATPVARSSISDIAAGVFNGALRRRSAGIESKSSSAVLRPSCLSISVRSSGAFGM